MVNCWAYWIMTAWICASRKFLEGNCIVNLFLRQEMPRIGQETWSHFPIGVVIYLRRHTMNSDPAIMKNGRKRPPEGGSKGRRHVLWRVDTGMAAGLPWWKRGKEPWFESPCINDITYLCGVYCNYFNFKLGRVARGIREYDSEALLAAFFSNIKQNSLQSIK